MVQFEGCSFSQCRTSIESENKKKSIFSKFKALKTFTDNIADNNAAINANL